MCTGRRRDGEVSGQPATIIDDDDDVLGSQYREFGAGGQGAIRNSWSIVSFLFHLLIISADKVLDTLCACERMDEWGWDWDWGWLRKEIVHHGGI